MAVSMRDRRCVRSGHLVALALRATNREDRVRTLDQRVVECAEPRIAGATYVELRHPFIAERLGQRMRDVAKRTGAGLAAEPAMPIRAQRDAKLAQAALDHDDNLVVRAGERRIRGCPPAGGVAQAGRCVLFRSAGNRDARLSPGRWQQAGWLCGGTGQR